MHDHVTKPEINLENMGATKYCYALAFMYCAAILLIALVNLLVDPYGLFGSRILTPNNVNERFAKIYYLDKHRTEYSTYLFGSSTIGLMSPRTLDQYLPTEKAYNLYVSNGSMADYALLLNYFIKNRYPIKVIILQLDPDAFLKNDDSRGVDYSRRNLPEVTGESASMFYIDYLLSFSPQYIWEKLAANMRHAPYVLDVTDTGTWRNSVAEGMSPHEWTKIEPTFGRKVAPEYKGEDLDKNISELRQFVVAADENHIKVLLLTQATNHVAMGYLEEKAYLRFLSKVAEIEGYWDFGGYNTITSNDDNYYDIHHARPAIADLMLGRMFGDKTAPIPKDFGIWIDKYNAASTVDARRENIDAGRENIATSVEIP
jgi:hypothetical protein